MARPQTRQDSIRRICGVILEHARSPEALDTAEVEGHLRNYILPTFRRFQIANIKSSDVRAWISGMMRHGLSPATIKAIHGTFVAKCSANGSPATAADAG
jgi:hypothetical protein